MGLTIHYSFEFESRSETKVRRVVEQLRERAMSLPLSSVGEIIEVEGDSADFTKLPEDHPQRWLLIQSTLDVRHGKYSYTLPPKNVIAFETHPGDGCEPANFGLCKFPANIEIENPVWPFGKKRIRSGAGGWRWSSFCKTQYASNSTCGGINNFLRCHLSVIALLDHAKTLGILSEVSDEGEFWVKRSPEALVNEVGDWNIQLAGMAGAFKDAIGDKLQAAILAFPNFERLEAQRRSQ